MTKQELEKETDKLNRELEPYIGAIPEVLTLVKQKIWVELYGDGLSEEFAWVGGDYALVPMGYKGRFTVVIDRKHQPFWDTEEEALVGLTRKLDQDLVEAKNAYDAHVSSLLGKRGKPIRYAQSHTIPAPLSPPETP